MNMRHLLAIAAFAAALLVTAPAGADCYEAVKFDSALEEREFAVAFAALMQVGEDRWVEFEIVVGSDGTWFAYYKPKGDALRGGLGGAGTGLR